MKWNYDWFINDDKDFEVYKWWEDIERDNEYITTKDINEAKEFIKNNVYKKHFDYSLGEMIENIFNKDWNKKLEKDYLYQTTIDNDRVEKIERSLNFIDSNVLTLELAIDFFRRVYNLFIKNHTLVDGNKRAFMYFSKQFTKMIKTLIKVDKVEMDFEYILSLSTYQDKQLLYFETIKKIYELFMSEYDPSKEDIIKTINHLEHLHGIVKVEDIL